MTPLAVVLVLLGLVTLSTVIGLLWRASQGRVKPDDGLTFVRIGDVPGVRRFAGGATLLQFSTEVCAPCRTARGVLSAAASEYHDVAHVDVDLTHRPDLAKQYRVMQTPTTLILDSTGAVRARIGGAPRPATVRAELDRILAA